MDTRQTAKQRAGVPAEIETVRRGFEQWRKGRKIASPIPERLWEQAVRLARRYGVSRISKLLHVGYYSLKQRVERHAAPAAGGCDHPPTVTFVELDAPAAPQELACLVEWEDTSGAKMRVQLQGLNASDLTALSRSFWEGRR
jgi:hypothetical protein